MFMNYSARKLRKLTYRRDGDGASVASGCSSRAIRSGSL